MILIDGFIPGYLWIGVDIDSVLYIGIVACCHVGGRTNVAESR